MRELLPVLISVILFIVTMVVIATLRKADQKNRKIEYIKKYVNNFSENMKQSGEEIQTKVVEVESKIHQVQIDTAVAVTKIQREKEELFSHLKDLEELQSTVLQYHEVLTSLSSMTENVENRLLVVKNDINEIKKVEHLIADFSISIEESRDAMDQMQQSLHQSFGMYQAKIETLIENSNEQLIMSFDEKRDEFTQSINPLLFKMNTLASSLFREVDEQVEKVEHEIEYLQQATSASLSQLKQHVNEKEKETEVQQALLVSLKEEREALRDEIRALQDDKEQTQSQLTQLVEQKSSSLEELELVSTTISSSKNELDTINTDLQHSKDELLSLEDEIAQALKIKEQLQKEEEIASLLEREEVDYPTFDDEIDDYDESNIEEESTFEELQEELFEEQDEYDDDIDLYDEEESQYPLDESEDDSEVDDKDERTKKKKIVEHFYTPDEKEEDELEIIIDEDDE